MRYDLVLLHPPSVYDFRKTNQFRGPMSDVIPSSSIFDMYAIGLTSIAGYLERFGYRVKIVNLAARMLHNPRFDVEKKIRRLQSAAFGISLHWLPHAQGSIEIAKLVKKYHPNVPVIVGGLSATYYHTELIQYDCVDFVMRGDSTEKPMLMLMQEIKSGGMSLSAVPNLTWKRFGRVLVNQLSQVPADLDDIDIPDYRYAVRSVFKYRSLLDVLPYEGWLEYPVSALLTIRGCTQDCCLCGGSRSAYESNCERPRPAMRSPAKLIEDIEFIQRFSRTPIFVIGDIRQGGTKYVDEFLDRVAAFQPKNELVFELFWSAEDHFFTTIERKVPKYSLEITLESADENIRRENGKFACSNQAIVRLARSALDHGCRKLDIFFMGGLPHQTRESALRNVDFCEEIHKACGLDKRLHYFIAPLAPFLDPGSRAFERPEKFGFKRLATTLEEHIRHFSAPSWEYILNYETDRLDREQIVKTWYASMEKLNDFKLKYGLIEPDAHRRISSEVRASLAFLELVRDAVRANASFENLPVFVESNQSVARTQSELRWKVKRRYPNFLSLSSIGLKLLLDEMRALILRRGSLLGWSGQRSISINAEAAAETLSADCGESPRNISSGGGKSVM
jgi:B12-binding domain/radical SAM domain protein